LAESFGQGKTAGMERLAQKQLGNIAFVQASAASLYRFIRDRSRFFFGQHRILL
jgi:hypothetical protein